MTLTSKNNINKVAFMAVVMGFVFYCYEYLLRISPSVMSNELMNYFKINATLFGTFSAFYYYSYTPMQLFVGVIVDKYDIKKILFFATMLCATGTLFLSFSDRYSLAVLGRFCQGFGSAFAWVGILKLGALFLPQRFLGFVSGVGSVFGFLGAAVGQLTMGYIVTKVGFKYILDFLAIVGLPLAFIIYKVIGIAEAKLTLNADNPDYKKAKPTTIKFKWVWVRFMYVLRKKQVWQAGLIAGLTFLPTIVFAELWGVEYIKIVYNYNTAQASFVTAMIFVGWAIGSLLFGIVSIFVRQKILIMRLGVICALITSLIMLYVQLPYIALCSCCVFLGIFSAVEILTFPMGMESVNIKMAGTAAAFVNFLCMFSGVIFQRMAGQLLDFWYSGGIDSSGVRVYSVYDYKHAIIIIPIALALCAGYLIFFVKDHKNKLKTTNFLVSNGGNIKNGVNIKEKFVGKSDSIA